MNFFKYICLASLALSVAVTGCSKQARKARHEVRADKYYAAGQFAQAEIEYLNAAKLDPDDAHAIGRLGLIYFDEGRVTRAYPFLSKAVELNPDDPQVRIKLGYLNLSFGNAKEARAAALAILDKNPKYPEAAFLLAETARGAKDTDSVRQRLEKLVQQTGVTAETEIGFGTLAFQSADFTTAEKHFVHAQILDTNSASALHALGVLRWVMNDVTNADHLLARAAELSKPRSSERLGYADFKIKTGDVDTGKQLLTGMTKTTPDYIPAWIALAELNLAQKHFEECRAIISQVQVRDPDNYQIQLLGARLKLIRKDYDGAITDYERLAARFKNSPQVFYQLGLAYIAKDDLQKALRNINQAVDLDPNFNEALIQQAQLNIQKDSPDLAIESMTALIKRQPKSPMPYLILAGAYAKKGDMDNAVATCHNLEKLFPDNPQIPYVTGGFYLTEKNKTDARREFSKSWSLSPNFLPAMEQLVNLDLADKKYDSAMNRVQAEIEKHPDYPDLQTLRARVFLSQSNFVAAESALRKSIELDANYRPAYLLLANLYVTSKKNDQALKELNEVVNRNTNDVTALMLIGMIENQQSNYTAARVTYEKLLQINPNFPIALNNLAYLYSEQFNLLDKAFDAANKARNLSPNDPAAADTLGWIVFKRGDYSWALSLLQSSADRLPDEPEVLYHLGMTYYMMGDEVRAKRTFTRMLALPKEFSAKDEARKRLALMNLDFSHPNQEIIATLEKRIAEQPDDPIALGHLAQVYEQQGQREKAAQVYEQVLKQNSNNPKLLINLAKLYADHLNNPQKALDLAKDAYKLAPNDSDVAQTLGRLALGSGEYKWALSLLQSAQKQSANPELLYNLAWALYANGRVSDAQSTMQDAVESDPKFARAADAKQFLDFISLASDPAKAAQQSSRIQNVLATKPDYAPALMAAAVASENLDNRAAASENCEQILKQYPDFTPAMKKLAIYYSEEPGKEQRAYELGVKAREISPNDSELAKALGIISYRRGDFQGAARLLNQSTRAGVADGKSLYYLGMAQYQLKRSAESKSTLQQALTQKLPDSLAQEARRVLAQLK
jgi:tetratricopeptide (TPR) repeat protein